LEDKCYLCNEPFSWDNKPTLDRIDNSKGHSKENVKPCCLYCNKYKSNRDEKITKLFIQLRKFAIKNNLPMTLSSKHEAAYNVIRSGITGGVSNVHHRENLKDETQITRLSIDENDNITSNISYWNPITHCVGVDFNSLYPSSFSSIENENNPYTNNRMNMPGRITSYMECNSDSQKRRAHAIIFSRKELFITDLKGHIDRKYWNEFINFPPIFRNIDIETKKEIIGKPMYDYMKSNNLGTDKKERKLTQLMDTNG
jgi:hypothetical protein